MTVSEHKKKSKATRTTRKEKAAAGGGCDGGTTAPTSTSPDKEQWYQNNKIPLLYLVVLAASMSLPYFRKLNDLLPRVHPGLVAVLAGVIITVLTYGPMRYADPKMAFSHALLLGLLVSEFVVYGAPFHFPAPVAISFFFFMFSYGVEESDHLWPKCYGK